MKGMQKESVEGFKTTTHKNKESSEEDNLSLTISVECGEMRSEDTQPGQLVVSEEPKRLFDYMKELLVSWKPTSTNSYDIQLSNMQVGFLGTIFTSLLALAFGMLTNCRDVYPSDGDNGATTGSAIARIAYIISGTVMGVLSSLILTYLALTQFPRGGRGPFYLKCLLLVVMGLVLFILTLLLCSLL